MRKRVVVVEKMERVQGQLVLKTLGKMSTTRRTCKRYWVGGIAPLGSDSQSFSTYETYMGYAKWDKKHC